MKTWTLTWETMEGEIRVSKIKDRSMVAACDRLCRMRRVANILSIG